VWTGDGEGLFVLFFLFFFFLAMAVFFWLNLAVFQNVFFFPSDHYSIFIFLGGAEGGINPNFCIQF
jgi:hypothetical protein